MTYPVKTIAEIWETMPRVSITSALKDFESTLGIVDFNGSLSSSAICWLVGLCILVTAVLKFDLQAFVVSISTVSDFISVDIALQQRVCQNAEAIGVSFFPIGNVGPVRVGQDFTVCKV